MLKFIIRRPHGQKPFTYGAFLAVQLSFWLYTIAWFTFLTWIYFSWDAPLTYKLGATVPLALLTPDAHTLFQSYQQYKDEWARTNPQGEKEKK